MKTTPTELLKELIGYDTTNPPGNEQVLAEWMAGELANYGFVVETPTCGDDRASVVARLHFGEGKKLVYNGHLDVVPAGEGWSSQPFVAEERNGRLYGRGAADMKGGVAAMTVAALALAANPEGLAGELILNFVADEEIYNKGTLSSAYAWQDADAVVIGEPSECDLHIAHRGTARFHITIHGNPCHSSMPQNGVNAIEKAAAAIFALKTYGESLKSRIHPILPSPTAVVTLISGGEKDNIVPGTCVLSIDRRMIPGDTGDSVEAELKEVLDALAAEDKEFTYTMERYICLDAGGVMPEDEIVAQAQAVYQRCFGVAAKVRDFPATCEQSIFTQKNIPTIIFGPGSIDQAHIIDEYVELDQLEKAVRFYEQFARRLLGKDDV